VARLDLTIEAAEIDQKFAFEFEYNTDLFTEPTIARLQQHYERLISEVVADPLRPVARLTMSTDQEHAALIASATATARDYPRDARIHELIAQALDAAPDRIAVKCGAESLTAREILTRARSLSASLRQMGIQRGDIVAVCVDRSVDMPVVMLGVLQAGAAYVPLDPIYPADRLEYMLADSEARVIVAHRQFADRLPSGGTPVLWVEADTWTSPGAEPFDVDGDSMDLAYVIYTSGSTGRPKGVEIAHRSVVNFLLSMKERPGLTAGDRLLAVTTLCFDIAGLEMYLPLLCGAELIIAPRSAIADPAALSGILETEQVTTMQATPATWRMLLESGWTGHPGFTALCGGEALPRELASRILAGGSTLWNLYGPTETTIWSTVERVEAGEGPVLVGTPIANTSVYVMDRAGHPVPSGVAGELCIGGDGVAVGYRRRPDLTSAVFLQDPFDPARRMYRTGDLARWRQDGRLELLGRMDGQIKLRGYRIELGEIEAVLQQQPGVSHAVVILDRDAQRLIGYLTTTPDAQVSTDAIRSAMVRTLPDYMVPSAIVVLPRFPLTPNGKVDKKALPAPATDRPPSAYGPPVDAVEEDVAGIWATLLRVQRVARDDNFFDLGGHSMLLVQLQSRLKTKFRRNVTLLDLFQSPTVSAIAKLLRTEAVPAAGAVS
jgi:amino acid adenylation domain-containing protein